MWLLRAAMCISDKELWRGNVLLSGYLADTEVEG